MTSEQYQNAAITGGIKNAEIHIASVEPVTGEGALAGIYKAYEEKGNNLNTEDIQNSNQEMNDLGTISEENKGKDGYSDEALNASIADIKNNLQILNKIKINKSHNNKLKTLLIKSSMSVGYQRYYQIIKFK